MVIVLPLTCPHEPLEAPGVALTTLIGDAQIVLSVSVLVSGLAVRWVVAVVCVDS